MPSTPSPFQGPPCLASYLFSIHTLLPSGAAPQTGRCFSWLCALYIYERCTRHLGIVTAIFTPNCNMLSTCPSPLTRLQVLRMDSVACSPTRQYTSSLFVITVKREWALSCLGQMLSPMAPSWTLSSNQIGSSWIHGWHLFPYHDALSYS